MDNRLEYTRKDFERIRLFVTKNTGIVLTDAKQDMVYGRLSKRVRKHFAGQFARFCDAFEAGDPVEQEFLINAITTNLTSFFREQHHFDFLGDELLPLLLKKNASSRRLRIWSAGCSTGEEPYSIAMTIRAAVPMIRQWDIKILATDLDANVLAHARAGLYNPERVEDMRKDYLQRWFTPVQDGSTRKYQVSPELQSLIVFNRLNLLNPWPMRGKFDIIFCRNVVIYFDKETQKVLFSRFKQVMQPEGHLFIGHSETLYKVSQDFTSLGHTIYQQIPG